MISKPLLCTLSLLMFGDLYSNNFHLVYDILIMTMYNGECITLQKDKARRLPRMSIGERQGLTNSVDNFILTCRAGEFSSKTNSCRFLDAYYSRFGRGDDVLCYALCLTYFHKDQRRLIQFAILPNGDIIDALPSKKDEIYVITDEPIHISEHDMELLGGSKNNVYYTSASDLIRIDEVRIRLLINVSIVLILVAAGVIWKAYYDKSRQSDRQRRHI